MCSWAVHAGDAGVALAKRAPWVPKKLTRGTTRAALVIEDMMMMVAVRFDSIQIVAVRSRSYADQHKTH